MNRQTSGCMRRVKLELVGVFEDFGIRIPLSIGDLALEEEEGLELAGRSARFTTMVSDQTAARRGRTIARSLAAGRSQPARRTSRAKSPGS